MAKIYNSLGKLITHDLITQASYFEKDSVKTSFAVYTTVSSLFGVLIEKGNNVEVEKALNNAGNHSADILSNVSAIFSGRYNEYNYIGVDFLKSVLGSKIVEFSEIISKISNISKGNSLKIVTIVSCFFSAFLGNKYQNSSMNLEYFINELSEERNEFLHLIPMELAEIINISSIEEIGNHSNITQDINIQVLENHVYNVGESI